MKITYISHATLLIEVDGIKILTDPWVHGPAYCEQWYIFPPPVDGFGNLLKDIDFVLISHGHEDHCHHETLKLINRTAKIYYPYSWYDGAAQYFENIGFTDVKEALNEKKYALSKDVSVTYYANNLDNVLAISSKDHTLIDINDALPSAAPIMIDYFVQKLKTNHPCIDFVFSSYGGASYYPNTIKCDWKDDMEVGKLREVFILNNFCKIIKGLDPEFAIPFASDFVLLDEDQQWMNKVKFPRNKIPDYFKQHYPKVEVSTRILELYPGDKIVRKEVILNSDYHKKFEQNDIDVLVQEVYQNDIDKKHGIELISNDVFMALLDQVEKHVMSNAHIVPENIRKALLYSIQISDYSNDYYIGINLTGSEPAVELLTEPPKDQKLTIKLKSQTLNYSLNEEWGGDAIIIGYGCEITVYHKESIENDLDNYAVQLLTRYPNTRSYIKKNPFRAMKYLFSDKIKRKVLWDKVFDRSKEVPYMDPVLKSDDIWLSRSNCDICKKCNMPLLTEELAEKFYGA